MSIIEMENQDNLYLDGVNYASFKKNNLEWKVGSVKENWMNNLPAIAQNEGEVYISDGTWAKVVGVKTKLAVMCGGLGSSWPGMGRELYDNFPVCRQAMDRLAAAADWDLLSVMDETDSDYINQTRVQIPYLFLVEYAQWAQFVSLGLKPSLICGHSLGELVALCFAGVYSPETAWHLLDTRAEHIARVEKKMIHAGGMLAIVGDRASFETFLSEFPQVHIANYNTPRQYIISGPREDLLFIRKNLRKKRIPAIMLNMHLPFHNPAMRILRDLSIRRLNALEMTCPKIPMLSCVTNGFYPDTQERICEYILDLDENTVNWVGSVEAMQEISGINSWLELGPQETLCSLVTENLGDVQVIPSSRKEREAETLREACARLYANDLLDSQDIYSQVKLRFKMPGKILKKAERIKSEKKEEFGECGKKIIQILSEYGRKKPEEINPDMDLRNDLAIRSSRFPMILQELEKKIEKKVAMENLFSITNVRDLLTLYCDVALEGDSEKTRETLVELPHYERNGNFGIFKWDSETEKEIPVIICPARGQVIPPGKIIFFAAFNFFLVKDLFFLFINSGIRLAIPDFLKEEIERENCSEKNIIYIKCERRPVRQEWLEVLKNLVYFSENIVVIVLVPPIMEINENDTSEDAVYWDELCNTTVNFFSQILQKSWQICLRVNRIFDKNYKLANTFFNPLLKMGQDSFACVFLALECNKDFDQAQVADMCMRIIQGKLTGNLICRTKVAGKDQLQLMPPVKGNLTPVKKEHDWNIWECGFQYSAFDGSQLMGHGALKNPNYATICKNAPWVSVGKLLETIQEACRVFYPWLLLGGYSDLIFNSLIPVPNGITREGTIFLYGRPWLNMEHTPTKMVKMDMRVNLLADNGRKLPDSERVFNGLTLLTTKLAPLREIWKKVSLGVTCELNGLENFYERAGFGNKWQYIESIKKIRHEPVHDNSDLSPDYILMVSPQSLIAVHDKWSYTNLHSLINASVMGAWAVIALDRELDMGGSNSTPDFLQWELKTIGHIRFDSNFPPKKDLEEVAVFAKCAWKDKFTIRFNMQVMINGLQPIITLYYLEFNRSDL